MHYFYFCDIQFQKYHTKYNFQCQASLYRLYSSDIESYKYVGEMASLKNMHIMFVYKINCMLN